MGTLTYNFVVEDTDWYDANPLMSNFLQAKAEINGALDGNNFAASMNPTVNVLDCSEDIAGNSIQPAGDMEIRIPEGRELEVHLESAPTTTIYLRFSESGVTIGA